MKWFAGILIVAVMTAHLILGSNMNMHEEHQLEYKKDLPCEGALNLALDSIPGSC